MSDPTCFKCGRATTRYVIDDELRCKGCGFFVDYCTCESKWKPVIDK